MHTCFTWSHHYYSIQLPTIHLLSALSYVPTCWSVPYLCTFTCTMGLDTCARHPLFGRTDPYYTVIFYSSCGLKRPAATLLCNCTVIPVPLSTGPSLNEIILLQIKIVFFLVPNIYVSGRKLFLLRATEELAPTVWSVATPIGKTAHYSSWGGFSLV